MVKSWDNFTKDIPIRIWPDKLLVWNDIMKNQANGMHLYPKEKIEVVGIPQFDGYHRFVHSDLKDRKTYMKSIGADPNKKLIVFASEGKWSPDDPKIAKIIIDFIEKGQLSASCHLHIRPHFCWLNYLEPLFDLEKKGIVTVEKNWTQCSYFPDNWSPSIVETDELAKSMKFADLVITSPSTIVLDASFFDTPVINIAFEKTKEAGVKHSVRMLYETEYYKTVTNFKATKVVYNEKELFHAIETSISAMQPHDIYALNALKKGFMYKQDGSAGIRLANVVLQQTFGKGYL